MRQTVHRALTLQNAAFASLLLRDIVLHFHDRIATVRRCALHSSPSPTARWGRTLVHDACRRRLAELSADGGQAVRAHLRALDGDAPQDLMCALHASQHVVARQTALEVVDVVGAKDKAHRLLHTRETTCRSRSGTEGNQLRESRTCVGNGSSTKCDAFRGMKPSVVAMPSKNVANTPVPATRAGLPAKNRYDSNNSDLRGSWKLTRTPCISHTHTSRDRVSRHDGTQSGCRLPASARCTHLADVRQEQDRLDGKIVGAPENPAGDVR